MEHGFGYRLISFSCFLGCTSASIQEYILFQKAERRSQGKVSLGGVADLFQTPPAVSPTTPSVIQDATTPDSVLYADLPDTPVGPGEMLVSPLSSAKSSGRKSASSGQKSRKSVGVIGVKELFKRKSTGPVTPEGVQQMFKTPKVNKGKAKSVSPAGLKRLLATPKSKRNTEPASPSGVAALFPTPEIKKTKTPVKLVTPKASAVKAKGSRQKAAVKSPALKAAEPVLVITPVFVEELVQTKAKRKTPVKTRTTRRGQKVDSPAVKKVATPSPPKPKQGRKKRPAPETPSTQEVEPKAKKFKVATPVAKEAVQNKKAAALKSLKTPKQTPMKERTRRGLKVVSPAKSPAPKKEAAPSPVAKRGRRGMPVVAAVVEIEPVTKPVKAGAVVKKTKASTLKKPVSPSPVKVKRGTRGHPVKSPVKLTEVKKPETVVQAAKKGKLSPVKKPPSPSPVKSKRGTRGRPVTTMPVKKSTPAKKKAPAAKPVPDKKPEPVEEPIVVESSPAKKSPVKSRSTRRGGKISTPAKLKTPVNKRGSRKRPAAATPVQTEPAAKKAKPATPASVVNEKPLTPKKRTPAKSRITRRGKKISPEKVPTPQKAALPSPVKSKRGSRQKTIPSTLEAVPVIASKPETPVKSTTPAKAKKSVRGAKQPTPVKTAAVMARDKDLTPEKSVLPVKGRSTRRGAKIATPKKVASPVKTKGNVKRRDPPAAPVNAETQPKGKKAKRSTLAKELANLPIVEEPAVKAVILTPKMSPKPRSTRRGGKVATPKKSPVKSKKVPKPKLENEETAKEEKSTVVKTAPMQKRTVQKLKTPKKSPVKVLSSGRKAANKVKVQTKKAKTVNKMATPQKRVTRQRK